MKVVRFLLTFFIAVIVFAAVFLFGSEYLNGLQAKQSGDQLDEAALGIDNKIEPVVDLELLFLLVGVDENQEDQRGNSRTDTIMLVKVDTKSHAIDIVSIPRDSRVEVRGKMDKINHAHAYGGITLTMKTIRDFLNIDLDYYVKVNYEAVKEIVDAIGGVEVDVPFTIDFPTENAYIKKGKQKLDGHNALAYLRYRKGHKTGDLGRVQAQQGFMASMFKQLLQPGNIPKLPQLLKTYYNQVETNVDLGHVIGMIPTALKFDGENIRTHTIPGEDGYRNNISYYFPNQKKTKQLVNELFSDYILK